METPNQDYTSVMETLTSMFGNVLSAEVIYAVVESCDGDLNLAAEAIMNISTDAFLVSETTTPDVESKKHNTSPETSAVEDNSPCDLLETVSDIPPSVSQSPTMSYASASRSTGAVPKQISKLRQSAPQPTFWTNQLKRILELHQKGSRILILMRGVPGSGKSFLARQIIEATIGGTRNDCLAHILSTDDFFMVRGQYVYEKFRLSEAHDWNHDRVRMAVRQGLSPVIVDNTNVEIWEMEPYVKEGVRNGYIIEVVEPNTPWARKAHQLAKKNTHNVPLFSIKRMLSNYRDDITGEFLIKSYGLSYPSDLVPPVLRSIPTYVPSEPSPEIEAESVIKLERQKFNQNVDESQCKLSDFPHQTDPITSPINELNPHSESDEQELMHQQKYREIEKQLQEIEEVEEEWEKGESWEIQNKETTDNDDNKNKVSLEPRPQRSTTSEGSTPRDESTKNVFENVQTCDDWAKISMFMSPWKDEASTMTTQAPELPVTEMKSSSTCMEIGDTDLINPKKVFKVVTATPKDINLFHIPFHITKIPEKRMLDKSSMTNELLITEAYRCQNEEKHFVSFRKLFKNVPRAELRDVFDKCCGDVNWAVDIVLNGMVGDKQLQLVDREDISDTEEELQEQCDCLAAYNVIPDKNARPSTSTAMPENIQVNPTEASILTPKKMKIQSDSSLQLQHEIEKNFKISSYYYSDHVLKLKKWRNGDNANDSSDRNTINTPSLSTETVPIELPVTSKGNESEDILSIKGSTACIQSDDDESNASSLDETERTITVNLGYEFVAQLDDIFGRRGMTYPQSVAPKINIPISLLNEINAFWMESLMSQLDDLDKQNNKMLLEDEEFARQLALKEQELAQQGKEPEVPDFKEIMDMDFAISLYQKDIAEWRNKEPKDIAAKMSREKLYNLFPDMAPELLSELLMAHDNNFRATVEVLLMSTGKSEILEEKNGVNKFVMEKEMERQEKLLEEEKKALSEVEWPLLPTGSKVDMSTVNKYRQEAEQHLARRNTSYFKAQEYIHRGMTQVANYYSDIAAFHKKKYEQANSMAATSLMQIHAENCSDTATIDLHYLRVGEAKESLDLFLDTHIQKLRESTNKTVRFHTLFFITGRGLHSHGGPRVKPAVKRRLRERGLICTERNPGLLTARVCADDKLSYQVP